MHSFDDAISPAVAVAMLQGQGIKISERTLRERARELGACRVIGKAMFLLPVDIEAILEASKPVRRSASAPSASAWSEADSLALYQRLREPRKKRQAKLPD
ncbi:hypothetical protein [Rhizobium sp. RU20A]|uniref:hypothetical protein n=1 Tax=Rhizobium sp. RU20A TaxID=1907412 RepID=UPI00122CCF73|nr:hypothetical protein [Rhizobium sp. RU20A]